jgi:hypothetical protein
MTKADVKRLQQAINALAAHHNVPLLAIDGELGPRTKSTGRRVAWIAGVKLGTGRKEIPPRALAVINGAKRTPAERARARHRKSLRPLRLRAWDQMQHLIDLGVVEQGGNNHGPMVEKIIRANGGVPGEPWCGDTVAVLLPQGRRQERRPAWASVSWLERSCPGAHTPSAATS